MVLFAGRRSLGAGLGRRLRAGVVSTGGPFTIASLRNRWRADVGITTDTGVSSWVDSVASADLAQATAGLQPVYTASNTDLNSVATVDPDGTDDYLAAGVAADWTWMHNGTDRVSLYWAGHIGGGTTAYPLNTGASSAATHAGFHILYNSSTGKMSFRIYNKSGTALVDLITTTTISPRAPRAFFFTWSKADNDARLYVDWTEEDSATVAGTPSTDASPGAFNVGRLAGDGFYHSADHAEIALWYGAEPDRTALQAYSEARYGV